IRFFHVTGVQTCALPISTWSRKGGDGLASRNEGTPSFPPAPPGGAAQARDFKAFPAVASRAASRPGALGHGAPATRGAAQPGVGSRLIPSGARPPVAGPLEIGR